VFRTLWRDGRRLRGRRAVIANRHGEYGEKGEPDDENYNNGHASPQSRSAGQHQPGRMIVPQQRIRVAGSGGLLVPSRRLLSRPKASVRRSYLAGVSSSRVSKRRSPDPLGLPREVVGNESTGVTFSVGAAARQPASSSLVLAPTSFVFDPSLSVS
jgi:hypothetical protein